MSAAGSHIDAFDLLGLPERYDLEAAAIESAFFAKSRELHPDRFATAPADERVAALSRSRALNDAYQTVKKPVARAEYLLARAGVVIGDHEKLDPSFLMEILELREELAEARVAKRTSEAEGRTAEGQCAVIEALQAKMKARRDAAVGKLPALFIAHDLPAIKDQLIALRYLDRYLDECDAALDED